MTKKLTFRETIFVASMLFGMFFGAGNLIFPVSMGQMAGSHIWQAAAGFLITGVGLPLLGVAALGISRESGLLGLGSRVGRGYGVFFTCALYLTIGPLLRYPQMRQRFLYRRDGGDTLGERTSSLPGSLFFYLLCCGTVLRPQAGADHDLDRKGAEPAFSGLSCGPCDPGSDRSHGRRRGGGPLRKLCGGRLCHGTAGGI